MSEKGNKVAVCMCDGGGGISHAPSHRCTVVHSTIPCHHCDGLLIRDQSTGDYNTPQRWVCLADCAKGRDNLPEVYIECSVCNELHRAGRWKELRPCRLSDKGIEQLRAHVGIRSDGHSRQIFDLANEIIRLRKQMRAAGIEPDLTNFAENGWE